MRKREEIEVVVAGGGEQRWCWFQIYVFERWMKERGGRGKVIQEFTPNHRFQGLKFQAIFQLS